MTFNKEVLVVVIIWKVPFSNRKNDLYDSLIKLGAIILQIDSGVQHHKCIIVDGRTVSNGGCANLSLGAYSFQSIGRGNDGE